MTTIRPATEGDIPALLAVFRSAFSTSPFNIACFPPSDPSSAQVHNDDITKNLVDITLIERVDTNEVLGWMSWKRKDTLERVEIKADQFPKNGNPDLAKRFYQANVDFAVQHMSAPYWQLSIIVVKQEAQGLGIGAQLMAHGLKRVDEDGLSSCVNASRHGKGLYARHGYAIIGESDFGNGITTWHMRRDARASTKH